MFKIKRYRNWSDNQKQWWIFLWSYDPKSIQYGVVLDSGEPEYPGCHIRFKIRHWTFLIELPSWVLRPVRLPIYEGSDTYDFYPVEYGVTTFERSIHVSYGPITNDSSTSKTNVWFIPWRNWRFVRHTLYTPDHKHYITKFEVNRRTGYRMDWSAYEALLEGIPKVEFIFNDGYDGEEITASCYIEEREWRLGVRYMKFLSWFVKPKIRRSLDLSFDKEVGERKGSWKGGTVGTSCSIEPNEHPQIAFKRWCVEKGHTFVRQTKFYPPENNFTNTSVKNKK